MKKLMIITAAAVTIALGAIAQQSTPEEGIKMYNYKKYQTAHSDGVRGRYAEALRSG